MCSADTAVAVGAEGAVPALGPISTAARASRLAIDTRAAESATSKPPAVRARGPSN